MSEEKRLELTGDTRRFTFSTLPEFSPQDSEGKKVRQFSGVAYSGEVIPNHPYWGNVVFDLSSINVPDKLPALLDHDRGQRCGYVTASAIEESNGFSVRGVLLDNPSGNAVALESDQGFPWQMSVHIEPSSVSEIAAGDSANLNGRDIPGPLTIFKNSRIVEVSFTATGWDSNTSAAAMSRSGNSVCLTDKDDDMDLKKLQEQVEALESDKTALQASNAALQSQLEEATAQIAQFSLRAREASVRSLFESVGREYVEGSEDVQAFSKMPEDVFASAAKVLKEQFSKPAEKRVSNLFQHAATGSANEEKQTTLSLVSNAQKRAAQFSRA